MNFKETFLKLTEYTIPYGEEQSLLPLLPKNLTKDKFGNWYLTIGQSKTLFTCHLDSYCVEKVKVNHVIEGDIIKTDKTTILGADNKAGVTVLLYLIEQNVPGTYYFFISEEPISSAGWMGSGRLASDVKFLKQFDRAIAFDRKHYGSVITRQMAQFCCSDEFADALIEGFKKQGVELKKDPTGYYTDTGNFIGVIPECTNISVGVWNEHHENEYVDIAYVEKVAKAAAKIDWNSLPKVRMSGPWLKDEDNPRDVVGNMKKYSKYFKSRKDGDLWNKVYKILGDPYVLMNQGEFESGKEMWFNDWFDENPIKVVIDDGKIMIDDELITLKQLEDTFKEEE
jgi:hypothetical protein